VDVVKHVDLLIIFLQLSYDTGKRNGWAKSIPGATLAAFAGRNSSIEALAGTA